MDPNVAFILMSLGMLALWAEFNHPGAFVPGVVGLISIVLAVFALNLLPTRYSALVLILVAFALFALEAKFTSHGVLGIGGAICMTIGALLLVDGPIPEMRVNMITAVSVSIPIAVIAVFLMTLVMRTRHTPVTTGSEGMIGELGVAATAVSPEGKVFVHGELWNATSGVPIDEGSRVRVRAVHGLRVVVEPADHGSQIAGSAIHALTASAICYPLPLHPSSPTAVPTAHPTHRASAAGPACRGS